MSAAAPAPPPDLPPGLPSLANVSHETLGSLKTFVALLAEWNGRQNMVSRSSLTEVWHRHISDSAQLTAYLPSGAHTLADLGSGAGFPGLILAILRPDLRVTLYEATSKKCRFLAAAADAIQRKVDIRNRRLEDAVPEAFDVVTARACAPLTKLLGYAYSFQGPQTVNLLLKGQNIAVELTEAHKSWRIKAISHPSLTDSAGRILEIRDLARR